MSVHALEAEFTLDEVIVKTKPVSGFSVMSETKKFGNVEVLEEKTLDFKPDTMTLMSEKPETLLLKLKNSGREEVLNAVAELSGLPNIEYAEPNYIFSAAESPEDPIAPLVYNMTKISAPAVWDMNIDCSGVTVVVIDSGINYNHNYLKNNIWVNSAEIPNNGLDDDGNGYIDDVRGWNFWDDNNDVMDYNTHGSHVAGIIGAEENFTETTTGVFRTVRGVAPNVKLCALRVFNSDNKTSESRLVYAINYARAKGIKIFNMSLGASVNPQGLEDAIRNASDCIFIVSAGNIESGVNGNNDTHPYYPACYPFDNVISVVNSNENDLLSSGSCYGKGMSIAAPGTNIWSTELADNYRPKNGTSMSAPHVTGAAAVLKAQNPELSPKQIKRRLMENGDYVANLLPVTATGKRLNVLNSLVPVEIYQVDALRIVPYSSHGAIIADLDVDTSEPVMICLAFYDADNKLMDFYFDNVSTIGTIAIAIEAGVHTIKAFVWEDAVGLKPIDFDMIGVNP